MKKLHLPAALLIKLGYLSFEFFGNVSIGDQCTLVQEKIIFKTNTKILGYLT
jgi:micrococcal nuclease